MNYVIQIGNRECAGGDVIATGDVGIEQIIESDENLSAAGSNFPVFSARQ